MRRLTKTHSSPNLPAADCPLWGRAFGSLPLPLPRCWFQFKWFLEKRPKLGGRIGEKAMPGDLSAANR